MVDVNILRLQYGSSYGTVLNDGSVIPWKPMSIGKFIEYSNELKHQKIDPAVFETEIFRQCVVEPYYIDQMDTLSAGAVEAVSMGIMMASGPSSLEDLGSKLAMKRLELSGALHSLVDMVVQAFPTYSPEQVYNFDYDTLMFRAAQAEQRLIQAGVLPGPIFFHEVGDEQSTPQTPGQPRPPTAAEKEKSKMLLDDFLVQEQQRAGGKTTVITDNEITAHNGVKVGAEILEDELITKKLMDESLPVFGEYAEQIKRGEKPQIKPLDQRVAETKVQLELAKKHYATIEAGKNKAVASRNQQYDDIMEVELTQRARKRSRS